MPRRLSGAIPRSVVALAALGVFVIAGSQAHAANIGNFARISNGASIAHLPVPQPTYPHLVKAPRHVPYVLPPNHGGGGWK